MKYIYIIFLLITGHVYGQKSFPVKDKKFSGYVFAQEHFVFKSIENQKSRYTPSIDDIKKAESILACNKKYLKAHQEEMLPGYPIISKKLHQYARQYVGFIDKSGNKVLWVNFIYQKAVKSDQLSQDIVQTQDGGSHYWSVCINIMSEKLFDMKINGTS